MQNGTQTEVNIIGSGPLNYHATHLQNPDRLVLDFAGSHLKTSEKHIASNLDPVREIRLAQFTPEVSRVVIDLRQPARYNISTDGNTVPYPLRRSAPSGGSRASRSSPSSLRTVMTPKAAATTSGWQTPEAGAGRSRPQIPAPAAGSSGCADADLSGSRRTRGRQQSRRRKPSPLRTRPRGFSRRHQRRAADDPG